MDHHDIGHILEAFQLIVDFSLWITGLRPVQLEIWSYRLRIDQSLLDKKHENLEDIALNSHSDASLCKQLSNFSIMFLYVVFPKALYKLAHIMMEALLVRAKTLWIRCLVQFILRELFNIHLMAPEGADGPSSPVFWNRTLGLSIFQLL